MESTGADRRVQQKGGQHINQRWESISAQRQNGKCHGRCQRRHWKGSKAIPLLQREGNGVLDLNAREGLAIRELWEVMQLTEGKKPVKGKLKPWRKHNVLLFNLEYTDVNSQLSLTGKNLGIWFVMVTLCGRDTRGIFFLSCVKCHPHPSPA